jgi:hypothetical protein
MQSNKKLFYHSKHWHRAFSARIDSGHDKREFLEKVGKVVFSVLFLFKVTSMIVELTFQGHEQQ